MKRDETGAMLQESLNNLRSKIIQRGDLSYVSVGEMLHYVEELLQFPLGRELLEKGLFDIFWTDFVVTYEADQRSTELEQFILNRSPFILAWRELLQTFLQLTQKYLQSEVVLASIPCGAMRELLELNYTDVTNFKIIGIDIDRESLSLARRLGEEKGLSQNLHLHQIDAWQLPYDAEIDVITSCGLNIYVSDRKKVLDLYRQFFKALKPGGKLIIGFLTYPPDEGGESEWKLDSILSHDLLLEKVLFKDILDLQCRNFRTSAEFANELKEAGFSAITFHYDRLRVFPTVVAVK